MTTWTVAHQAPSVHRILQARILEWVAISFSRGSSRPRDRTCISCIGRQILYHWATWEAPSPAFSLFLMFPTYTHIQSKPNVLGNVSSSDIRVSLLMSTPLRISWQCLAHKRHSVTICSMNRGTDGWMNHWLSFSLIPPSAKPGRRSNTGRGFVCSSQDSKAHAPISKALSGTFWKQQLRGVAEARL